MAEKESKIILERSYVVPLRKGYMTAPKYRRAKKAMNTLKEFLRKHCKSDDVKIGHYLNKELWKHGIKNPPHHVKVDIKKNDSGMVLAELTGAPLPKEKVKKKSKAAEKVSAKSIDKVITKSVNKDNDSIIKEEATKPVIKEKIADKVVPKEAVVKSAPAEKPKQVKTTKPVVKPKVQK